MIEIPVAIPGGIEYLAGDLAKGGTDGAIIISGWGGTRYGPQRILLQTARALADAGLTTLRLDFRGRGDSPGDPGTVTLDEMIEDVTMAAEWLRTEHDVTRLHLIGICSGGNVALGVASQLPAVAQVVCWSLLPFMEHKAQASRQGTPRWTLLKQFIRKAFRPEAWRKLLRGEANVKGAVKVLAKDKEGDAAEQARKTSHRDILADLAGYQGRICLLYGSRDPESAGSRTFFTDWAARRRITCDTHTIDGAPHNFYTTAWTTAVVRQTVEWVINTPSMAE